MKNKYFLFLSFLLLSSVSFSQESEWEWVKQLGGGHDQNSSAIELDHEENLFITGSFWNEIIFENDTLVAEGEYDAYLAKYDNNGHLLWVKQIGGENRDHGYDITIDNLGNVYLTGCIGGNGLSYFGETSVFVYGNTDIFIAKYDNNGNLQWVRSAGGNFTSSNPSSKDCGRSVCIDSENNIYLTGSFKDTAFFNNDTLYSYGGVDIFVAKYNEEGELIWVDNYGSVEADNGSVVIIDNNDNLYIEGWFEDTIEIADTVLVLQDGMDNFILKLNPNGERIWIQQIGGSSAYSYKTSLAVDTENHLYVTDYFSGSINLNDTSLIASDNIDFYLSKYDPNGSLLWAKQYFNCLNIHSNSLSIDTDNNIFITGSYRGELSYQNNVLLSPYGYDDIFVSKFDDSGDFSWIISGGGIMNELGRDITCTQEEVYLTGRFTDVVTFGEITLFPSDNNDYLHDAYIAKIIDNTVQVSQIDNHLILSVFPNPNKGCFSLRTNGLQDQVYLEISNINGQVLLEREIINNMEGINISNYPAGLYFIKIRTEDFTRTEKICKQ